MFLYKSGKRGSRFAPNPFCCVASDERAFKDRLLTCLLARALIIIICMKGLIRIHFSGLANARKPRNGSQVRVT